MGRKKEDLPLFRERFKELLGDMTYEAFGDMCGISRQTVSYYVTGERVPDIVILHRIAVRTGVSTDWLLGLSDSKTSDAGIREVCELTKLSDETVTRFLLWRNKMPAIMSHFIDVLSSSHALADLVENFLHQYVLDWQGAMAKDKPERTNTFNRNNSRDTSPDSAISLQDEVDVHIEKCVTALKESLHLVAGAEAELAVSASSGHGEFNYEFFLNDGYAEYCNLLNTERFLNGGQPTPVEKLRFEWYASSHEISASDKSRLESALGLKASKAGAQTEREKS